MSNVIEMSPTIGLDEQQRQEVLECGKRIRTEKIALRKSSMSIGRDGAFIENLADRGSWQVLGCKNQHEYRIAEGIGRSNWYRVVAVAKKFLDVDRDVYMAMSMENAERLSVEPDDVRLDQGNLQAAASMTAEEFDDHLTTTTAHNEGKPKQEKWVQIHIHLREEQRKVIQEALQNWKGQHGIQDDAYAWELLCIEYADRPTLAGFILDSIPRLTGAVHDAADVDALKVSILEYLHEMAEIVHVCCGETEEVA